MIRDLLQPSSGILDLREDAKGGVQVAGLSEVMARSTVEVDIMQFIDENILLKTKVRFFSYCYGLVYLEMLLWVWVLLGGVTSSIQLISGQHIFFPHPHS